MKKILSGGVRHLQCWYFTIAAGLMVCSAVEPTSADQVQMRNGDQYFGSVLSLNKDTLVIQSDVLGTVRLPRNKVAFIEFGANPSVHAPVAAPPTNNIARLPALTVTNRANDFSATLQQLGGSSNVLQQIEAQYLGDAGPEAKAKFNDLLGGYLTGKLSVNDIRAQAQATADQVRSLRKDLGEDAGGMIDGYLAILDSFLKETAPPPTSVTNSPPARPVKPKPSLPEAE
jgi:hypothetical protein